jgi:hypothetical protein
MKIAWGYKIFHKWMPLKGAAFFAATNFEAGCRE